MLDSGAEGPEFKSQSRRRQVTVLSKLFTPIVPLFTTWAAKFVAALLRVAEVTAGLEESNGSLPPGLWLTSPAGWLPRTGISSGTLRSAVQYGLPLPLLCYLIGEQQLKTTLVAACLHRSWWVLWRISSKASTSWDAQRRSDMFSARCCPSATVSTICPWVIATPL